MNDADAPSPAASPGARPAAEPWTPAERWTFFAVLAAAVLVRFACFQGLAYFDSLNYVRAALSNLDGGLGQDLGFHQTNRLGMTVPPAVAMALAGRTEAGAILYFVVLAAAELLLVPRLLARILPAPTVIVATALYFLMPQAVRGATSNVADIAMSAWANLGLLLVIASAPARRVAACAAGGLLLGVAALHKETALVLLPVAVPVAIWGSGAAVAGRLRCGAALALGVAVPLAAEAVLFHGWTGDPLFRYRVIEATHVPTVGAMAEVGRTAHYLRFWPANLLRSPCELGALTFLLPAALVLHAANRARGAAAFAGWALFAIGYAMFGTTSRSGWHPLLPCPRYLHYGLLPAAVLTAQAFTGGIAWPAARWVRAAALALPVALAAGALTLTLRGAESAASACAAVAFLAVVVSRGADAGRSPRTALLVAALAAVPLAMAAERAVGRSAPALAPIRTAIRTVEAAGFRRVLASSQTFEAIRTLRDLGEAQGIDLVHAPHDTLVAAGGDAATATEPGAVLTTGQGADALTATGRYRETARIRYRTDVDDAPWDVHVLLRSGD